MAAEPPLLELMRAIAAGDAETVSTVLQESPALARETADVGATRRDASTYYLDAISHYVYGGDTALHIAAAAHQPDVALELLARDADVGARNRRGAQPLH